MLQAVGKYFVAYSELLLLLMPLLNRHHQLKIIRFFFFFYCFLAGPVIFYPSFSHQHSISENCTYIYTSVIRPEVECNTLMWTWNCTNLVLPRLHTHVHIVSSMLLTESAEVCYFGWSRITDPLACNRVCLQEQICCNVFFLYYVKVLYRCMNKDSAGKAVKCSGKTPT